MTSTFRIAVAEPTAEMNVILRLIRQASGWLKDRGTDQWTNPWPDQETRDARVGRGLEVGATWIAWAGSGAAATVTVAQTPKFAVWQVADRALDEPAVYAHRLIVDRQFAGFGLGAQLIDWIGLSDQREWEAEWIRIDVWSTNKGLHEYYMKRGFEPCGRAPDPEYPQRLLFQKSVSSLPAITVDGRWISTCTELDLGILSWSRTSDRKAGALTAAEPGSWGHWTTW